MGCSCCFLLSIDKSGYTSTENGGLKGTVRHVVYHYPRFLDPIIWRAGVHDVCRLFLWFHVLVVIAGNVPARFIRQSEIESLKRTVHILNHIFGVRVCTLVISCTFRRHQGIETIRGREGVSCSVGVFYLTYFNVDSRAGR